MGEKNHIKNPKNKMENVICGKLDFLKMVKGETNSTYISLRKRYNLLLEKDNQIDNIIEVWQLKGIEEAIKIYLN